MTIENPMLNKKSSLLNIKQKVDEKSTGQEFIENKNTDININVNIPKVILTLFLIIPPPKSD